MGVHGWTWFLTQQGWMPAPPDDKLECRCISSSSPWRNPRTLHRDDGYASRITSIPNGSTMYVDGYGLAFYLYDVAYDRYVQSILGCSPCHISPKAAGARGDLQRLIPMMMPLSLIEQVTKEYVTGLMSRFKVIVYFDGNGRRQIPTAPSAENATSSEVGNDSVGDTKQETTKRRMNAVCDTWENLRIHSDTGAFPPSKTICTWKREFPRPRLMFEQFRHVLENMSGVTVVQCDEESDVLMARAVTGVPRAYIVGHDSDFCFFPNVNYIPFATLDVEGTTASALVIRRSELATHFGIEDDDMVELAILCGNDYLVDPANAGLDFTANSRYYVQACVDHLKSQAGCGYRVSSSDEAVEKILLFIRTQYSLGDLEQYPLVERDTDADDAGPPTSELDMSSPSVNFSSAHPKVPPELDVSLAKAIPGRDVSVKDAVLRCLEDYVSKTNDKGVVTRLHLEAFRATPLDTRMEKALAMVEGRLLRQRQDYWDNYAMYIITKAIAVSLNVSPSRLVQTTPPSSLFDAYQFHALLHEIRYPPQGVDKVASEVQLPHHEDELPSESPAEVPPLKLPIDDYEEIILERIRTSRVSIVQAETGAGKSSRVPVMILRAPPPDPSVPVKMFISQPRRIAAKALVERLRSSEPELRDCFALRMGHGVREYESNKTRATFVTAGYLVRLMVNSPGSFSTVSHLVIDEVHERSVETDLLCLLCRRLLHENERIRLVLMSATLASELYREYFSVPDIPLKVGARRFTVDEVFLEDLERSFKLTPKIKRSVASLIDQCKKFKCKESPQLRYMEELYPVVASIAAIVGRPGTSVLVFVPGMNDIVAVTEEIEKLWTEGVKYTCLPIHSDIPFEDQLDAFQLPSPDEVKVIIATNAAESSVTLPAVDSVICTGLCKQITYNEASHRQMLTPTWISRASATQRAGRTGRLRPGTVYRMYTRENFESHMEDFEAGEMSRIPLDSVILMLREMMSDDSVTKVLLDCLEPPNLSTIDRSFKSLYDSHFITSPDDECQVTRLGSFVTALGIDLALGSVIGLGIQMGVGEEAIQLAGVLSFPKSPWVITNPLIHGDSEFNEKSKGAYVSRCNFDANLFSDPLAAMNMLWRFEKAKNKDHWCFSNFLAKARVHRLAGSCASLRKRVAEFFNIDEEVLRVAHPPSMMPHSKINLLRVIQVWVFHDSLIESVPKKSKKGQMPLRDEFALTIVAQSGECTEDHLKQVLCSNRHQFKLQRLVKTWQTGEYSSQLGISPTSTDGQERFISFAIEKDVALFMSCDEQSGLRLYVDATLCSKEFFGGVKASLGARNLKAFSVQVTRSTHVSRGIGERASGQWIKCTRPDGEDDQDDVRRLVKFTGEAANLEFVKQLVCRFVQARHEFKCVIVESINKKKAGKKKKKKSKGGDQNTDEKCEFSVTAFGFPSGIPLADLGDLFGSGSSVLKPTLSHHQSHPSLVFPTVALSDSATSKGNQSTSSVDFSDPSWSRPVLPDCIPEGARIMSVLGSGRRRMYVVKLRDSETTSGQADVDVDADADRSIVVGLDTAVLPPLMKRWKRMNAGKDVFVYENCVPATALSMNGRNTLYCVASNVLELRGGGMKVEGLTLLPPGRLFLMLALLSFGVFKSQDSSDVDALIDKCILWLQMDGSLMQDDDREDDVRELAGLAIQYHRDSLSLGEELNCFPDFARRLVEIFDGVDGYEAPSWDIDSNPFTKYNLIQAKRAYAQSKALSRQYSSFGGGGELVPVESTPFVEATDGSGAGQEGQAAAPIVTPTANHKNGDGNGKSGGASNGKGGPQPTPTPKGKNKKAQPKRQQSSSRLPAGNPATVPPSTPAPASGGGVATPAAAVRNAQSGRRSKKGKAPAKSKSDLSRSEK